MASPIGGIDPAILDQIRQLMAGMGPSDSDKEAARRHAILTAGLGIMQNTNLNPILAAGRGGLLGQQAYTDELRFEQQQRAQNMAGVAQMFPLLQKSAFMNLGQQYLNGGPSSGIPGLPQQQAPNVTPEAGVAPSTAAQFGPMNGMPTGSMGMPPAPLSVPAGTPADQIAGYYTPPDPRREAPPGVLGMAFGSGDPKLMVDTLTKFSQDVPGRNGMVFSPAGRPKYQITDAGIQFFNQDGTPGRFVANGQANTQAAAQRAGAMKGAETSATEAAKWPYNVVTAQGPNGPISGLAPNLYGTPESQNAPNGVPANVMDVVRRDMAKSGTPNATLNYLNQTGAAGTSPVSPDGLIHGPDPVQQAAAIDAAKGTVAQGQKQLEDMQTKRPIALSMISGLDNMARLDAKGVFNGPAQNMYQNGAVWLNSMFPWLNLDVNTITNSQAYDSSLKQIARSGLKAFGGRTTNTEFLSVLQSLPSRIATPQGREQMRNTLGAAALDELGQLKSAEDYYSQNPSNGLLKWTPPNPLTSDNYWQARKDIMGQSRDDVLGVPAAPQQKLVVNRTAVYKAQQAVKAGADPAVVKQRLISNGVDPSGL